MVDQDLLAAPVALVLAVQLGHGDVGLVDDDEEVVGEEVEEGVRRLARTPAVDGRRVVLDAVAVADLLHHLEVVLGAHPEALGLEELALLLELGQLLLQLGLDADRGVGQAVLAGDVVGGRVDGQVLVLGHLLAGERVDDGDGLDLVAEERDAHRRLVVGGMHLERVAPHPELAPDEVLVVPVVLHVDQLPQHGALVVLLPHLHVEQVLLVLAGRTEAVDARHRGDDDHVPAGEQRRGGCVAEPVDLVVDGRVLLDVGVARRHVGLGLVVVVVADEVLDLVVREELPELAGQLRGQALVRGDDQRGPLGLLDGPADRGALARAGDAEEGLVPLPARTPSVSEAMAAGWSPAGL